MTDGRPPAGWFPDPLGRYDHRWFNGHDWTADVSVGGQRFVDPLGTAAGVAPTRRDRTTIALVCGVVGLAIAWIPLVVVVGTVLGIVAVVAGLRAGRPSARGTRTRARVAVGLGLGTLVVSIVGWVFTVGLFREVVAYVEPGPRLVADVGCAVEGGSATVRGTLTNLDDRTRSYTLFAALDGGPAEPSRYAELVDVPPALTTAWEIRLDGVDAQDGPCDVDVIVNGPFPWGIATDPYRD